jgi:hypothetical protein
MSRKRGLAMAEEQPVGAVEPAPPGPGKDPVVLAAQRMVVEMFSLAAKQMPDLMKAQVLGQAPNQAAASAEVQKFTEDMLSQLQAQVTRALGVEPETKGDKT